MGLCGIRNPRPPSSIGKENISLSFGEMFESNKNGTNCRKGWKEIPDVV